MPIKPPRPRIRMALLVACCVAEKSRLQVVFRASHMVGKGEGCWRPYLSRVGAARSVAYLIDAIRHPGKELSSGMTDASSVRRDVWDERLDHRHKG